MHSLLFFFISTSPFSFTAILFHVKIGILLYCDVDTVICCSCLVSRKLTSFTNLDRYLTNEDIRVVKAASCALFEVLSTKDGMKAFGELSHSVKKALVLFLPPTKPKTGSTSNSGNV